MSFRAGTDIHTYPHTHIPTYIRTLLRNGAARHRSKTMIMQMNNNSTLQSIKWWVHAVSCAFLWKCEMQAFGFYWPSGITKKWHTVGQNIQYKAHWTKRHTVVFERCLAAPLRSNVRMYVCVRARCVSVPARKLPFNNLFLWDRESKSYKTWRWGS